MNKMQCYHVTVPFEQFWWFHTALETLGQPPDHYSTILYQVGDLQLEYRVGYAPIAAQHMPVCAQSVYTCPTRPGLCVYASVPTAPVHVAKWPDLTSVPLTTTTLREHWNYTTPTATYRLTKAATAATKGEASRVPPRFYVTALATTEHCVVDLFGRFRHGVAESLEIRHDTLPSGETPLVRDVLTSCF